MSAESYRATSVSERSRLRLRTPVTGHEGGYNTLFMRLLLTLATLLPLLIAQSGKRPLTHKDYEGWRSIASQRISPDGKWVAYAVFPQEGDGEVVVRHLQSTRELREGAGQRPQAQPPDPAAQPEEGPAQQPGVTMAFSEDSRFLVTSTFPMRAETEQAKKDKKPAEEMPKGGIVIFDLAAGKATRVARVKSFRMPLKAAGYVAYLREAAEKKPDAKKDEPKKEGEDRDQRRSTGTRPGGTAASSSARRPEFGTELVLRKLADGSEQTFADVVEFAFSDDGQVLLYAASSRTAEQNGVYQVRPADGAKSAVLAGKGKYAKIAWDDRQTQAAFLSDHDAPGSRQPKWKLYRWDRASNAPAAMVSAESPGFRAGFVLTDRGNLAFSKDGSRVFFATVPASAAGAAEESRDAAPSDDRPVVDLWHWKDGYIQPMQKVRAARERSRTFTAAYLAAEQKVVQLGDATLADVQAGDHPRFVVGSDDREYRHLVDYEERYADAWSVDIATGERKLIAKKHRGSAPLSPGGRYLLLFDGKDWSTVSVAEGKSVNLTANLGVKFANEDHDSPGTAQSYGAAGWTRDGAWVLLYDRFDVWQVAPDGGGAKNLTAGEGRKRNLQFRCMRFSNEDDPRDRWIDPAKPVLLRAENLETRETGFSRTRFGAAAPPVELVMASRNFGPPLKAKNAEVYLLTAQTFRECPDLYTSDARFHEMRKVSDVNPQQAQFVWGSAELVRYRNTDGVALSGALYKPDNFDPKKKYPLLVYIYERLSQNVHRYVEPKPGTSINIAYYVSNGYLVLTPDIAYTVGFPGQSALKAVLPAIQAVVDRGIVDENAIGIQGHSWGGYQIAYMITQTNRFRAVAAGAPVSNMISAYDGIRWGSGLPRQFQYERTQSRIGGSIWQYPTRFIENSPIFWADRVRTPVMILHNDNDDAVPWYQGIEYYLALRRLGREVYLFNYNGEPHGLRKRPNQKDYTVRLQQYFDHFLKGAPAPNWMVNGVPYIERSKAAATDTK
jgi:dienelactone hydrolase